MAARPERSRCLNFGGLVFGSTVNCLMPTVRLNLPAPATLYLSCRALFLVSTLKAFGYVQARRT